MGEQWAVTPCVAGSNPVVPPNLYRDQPVPFFIGNFMDKNGVLSYYKKMNKDKIEPRLLKGFADFLPERMIVRQKMIQAIKEVYELFGFLPLETPALEHADILIGKYGDEGEKLLYKFLDNGSRPVALRYDLTVPLARVVAQYPELKKPFKRYQVAPVWRAENTQKGRFREFYQCDADIIGTSSLMADAEILSLIWRTLKTLKVDNFTISINNRKVLDGLLKDLGLPEENNPAVLRIIDKVEKISEEDFKKELLAIIGDDKKMQSVLDFMNSQGDLDLVQKLFPSTKVGADELKEVCRHVEALGVDQKNYKIDFSIVRGLDYYTGTVYETKLNDLPKFGSVFSGGRFDNLISKFIDQSIPAVGASIGLDRLFAALEELGVMKKIKSTAKVLIVNLDNGLADEYQKIASLLRDNKINAMIYFEQISLGQQLSYASEMEIPYVLIYGSKEKEAGIYVLKDMVNKAQREIKSEDLMKEIVL